MNRLKLKEYNADYVLYLYQPEGKGEWGEIKYTFADGEPQITKRAGYGHRLCDFKAMSKVEKFVEENNFPTEFTQAWY